MASSRDEARTRFRFASRDFYFNRDIHSTPQHKNLEIFALDMGEIEVGNTYYMPFNFVSSHPAPAILHTSKEAREVGLKHYQPLFGTDFTSDSFRLSTPPRIYVNLCSDRICFIGPISSRATREICEWIRAFDIRRLAVNVKVIRSHFEDPTMDLMAAQRSWVDKDMDEVVLYYSSDWVSRGDTIRCVERDEKKVEAGEGVELKSALKMVENVVAKLQVADREHGLELRRPSIKLMSLEVISDV
jgi:hypothetical protein